jgi:hypothetical protein
MTMEHPGEPVLPSSSPPLPLDAPTVPPLPDGSCTPKSCASRLSDDLRSLVTHAAGKPITFEQVISVLQDRAHAIVLIIFCIPFLIPVPTMGMSAPMGLLVMLVGVFIACGLRPWLPKRALRREIPFATLEHVVAASLKVLTRVEKILKPRLTFLAWPGFRNFVGIALVVAGFIMALPIPLPFANAIPALAIVLLAAGDLERDGLFIAAGYLVTIAASVALYIFSDVAWTALQAILRFLHIL